MVGIDNSSNYEVIDNERVNIDKKLDKIEHQQAINFLNEVDSKIPYDIDLTYDKINKKYYFIGNEKFKLNIGLKLNDLNLIGNILIELFNKDIQLFGSQPNRSIAIDTLIPDGFENKIISSDGSKFSKNDIEKLFVFIMKIKGIPIEDWKIESTICANGNANDSCKKALGN